MSRLLLLAFFVTVAIGVVTLATYRYFHLRETRRREEERRKHERDMKAEELLWADETLEDDEFAQLEYEHDKEDQ